MAGFTPLAWVESPVPEDVLAPESDKEESMVSAVEDLIRCAESSETRSSRYKKLRGYIRGGICPVLRPNVWKRLSGGYKALEVTPNLFADIEDDLEYSLFMGESSFFNAQYLNKYHLNNVGWKKVQEVLSVLSQLHCDVTFCPILQPLTCLFMHFMDKEDCFACMDSIFSSKKHSVDKCLVDYCLTAASFQDAMKKWKNPAYTWFESLYKENDRVKTIFFANWLQWIFKAIDFWPMVHIVDIFLLEGNKILFRIGLALFGEVYKTCKDKDITCDDVERIFCEVASTWSKKPAQLLKKSLKIVGVSRRVISQLREDNVQLLSSGNLDLPDIEHEVVFSGPVENSNLLSESQIKGLFSSLPRRLRKLCKLSCIFSTEVHGTSLQTFYNKCQREPCTLLLVKTTKNEILGAFLSSPWCERLDRHNSFFGNGETFIFHFTPGYKRYTWCALRSKNWQAPSFFVLADDVRIVVGGGGAFGLCIEEDLTRGRSERCSTFENEPLTSNPGGEFVCSRVEVWCFKEMGRLAKSEESVWEDRVPKTELILDSE